MSERSRNASLAARAALILGLGLTTLAAGLGVWVWQGGLLGGTTIVGSGQALVGGPFELVDQDGQVRRDSDFAGRYMLIYFGYTYCPDVCPTSLAIVSAALETVGEEAEEVVPVFITVDPERDTIEHLKDYAAHFHPRLVALTGTPEQIDTAAKAYRVYYAKANVDGDDDSYLMDHTSITYLMGPDGRFITHFPHGTSTADMADGLSKALATKS